MSVFPFVIIGVVGFYALWSLSIYNRTLLRVVCFSGDTHERILANVSVNILTKAIEPVIVKLLIQNGPFLQG